MKQHDIVGVDQETAKHMDGEVGLSTWWSMDGRIKITEKLITEWTDAGLGNVALPPFPTPEEALARAVGGFRERSKTLVHGLPDGDWTVTSLVMVGDQPEYKSEMRVRLNKIGKLVIKPVDHKLASELETAFEKALVEISTDQITPWLTGYLRTHNGIRLRRQGGVYFLPPGFTAEWEKISVVLEANGGNSGRIVIEGWPAVGKANALRAILNAVTHETDELMVEIEKNKGSLGERGLETQISRCEEHKKLLDAYKELLGENVNAIFEKVDNMEVELGEAKIRLMSKKNEAKKTALANGIGVR